MKFVGRILLCAVALTLVVPVPQATASIPRDNPSWTWFDACMLPTDMDCIESLGVVDPDGKFLPGVPTGLSRPNSARGSKDLGENGIYNADATHPNATWLLPGVKQEYGTEWVVTEFVLWTASAQWYDFPSDTVAPAPGTANFSAGILASPTVEGFAGGHWGVPLPDFKYPCVTQNFAYPMDCQREANFDPNQTIRAVLRFSWYRAGTVESHLQDNVYRVEPLANGASRVTIEGRAGERPYFLDSSSLPRNPYDRSKIDTLFYGWRVNTWERNDAYTSDQCRTSGVPIITGNMFSQSTPSWNPNQGTLSVNVWAPHLDPNDRPYSGYYEGNFPNDYLSCMWKLGKQDVLSQFTASVTQTENGQPSVATISLKKTADGVRIVAANFHYSNERITFQRVSAAPTPTPAATSSQPQKRSITCQRGARTKRVTAANPKCPSGWKLKR